jgi:endoglucanase
MNKEFLKNILASYSPSGYEKNATSEFEDYMNSFGAKHEFSDKVGNVCYSVGDGKINIMLSAHVDEIALQVQNIDDKGFIHFVKDGGVDPKVLLGSTVMIMSSVTENMVPGIIGKKPIHVEYGADGEKDKTTKIKDMKIDIGVESKEEATALVNIGDPIIIQDIPMELGSNRFVGRGLDDKTGIFVVGEVMKQLAMLGTRLNNVKVYGVACTQEETTASGAVISAANINPQYSIDFDVTFATDDDYVSPNEWGDIKLGKGGAIAYGVNNNLELTKIIKNTCIDLKIPYQEFVAPSSGTNTVYIKQASSDCATQLLSIPNRNMHTQVEMCDYRDLQSLIDMTVGSIIRINDLNS